jgi:hypothetical protein
VGAVAAVWLITLAVASMTGSPSAAIYQLGAFEWIIPVTAGASVGLVAWVLLGSVPQHSDDAVSPLAERSCPACGHLMLADWRLCPHCGTLLDDRGEERR